MVTTSLASGMRQFGDAQTEDHGENVDSGSLIFLRYRSTKRDSSKCVDWMRIRRRLRRHYPRARRDAMSDRHVEIEILSLALI
jgi:hypothetical protein